MSNLHPPGQPGEPDGSQPGSHPQPTTTFAQVELFGGPMDGAKRVAPDGTGLAYVLDGMENTVLWVIPPPYRTPQRIGSVGLYRASKHTRDNHTIFEWNGWLEP